MDLPQESMKRILFIYLGFLMRASHPRDKPQMQVRWAEEVEKLGGFSLKQWEGEVLVKWWC